MGKHLCVLYDNVQLSVQLSLSACYSVLAVCIPAWGNVSVPLARVCIYLERSVYSDMEQDSFPH